MRCSTGFCEYELHNLPHTLRVLRLLQRQASLDDGVPDPIQLDDMISGSLRLDLLRFELLPATGVQLWQQDGQQASVYVDLVWLHRLCRRLEVVAPLIGFDCTCPRCTAEREAQERDDSGSAPPASVPWRPPGEGSAYFATTLLNAAALLADPDSLLECVVLRSTAADIAGPDADLDETAGAWPGWRPDVHCWGNLPCCFPEEHVAPPTSALPIVNLQACCFRTALSFRVCLSFGLP